MPATLLSDETGEIPLKYLKDRNSVILKKSLAAIYRFFFKLVYFSSKQVDNMLLEETSKLS